jgi:hypothetical protein
MLGLPVWFQRRNGNHGYSCLGGMQDMTIRLLKSIEG